MIDFMRHGLRLAVPLALLLAPTPGATAQEQQSIPGTTVALVPPDGFAPARDFTGFIHQDGIGTIVVEQAENTASTQSIAALATLDSARAHFGRFGHEVTSLKMVEGDGGSEMPLFSGTTRAFDQSGSELAADWWATYAVGASTVVLSMRSDPRIGLSENDVIDTFASIQFGAMAAIEEQAAALPYSVEAAEPYRLVSSVSGRHLLMTDGDKDADPTGQQSNVIISYEWAEGATQDQVAQAGLIPLGDEASVKVESREEAAFAGQTARRLEGRSDTPYGPKRFLLYTAVKPDGYYVSMLATFPQDRFDTLLPSVERMAGSLTVKD